jgi:hypothetical protein
VRFGNGKMQSLETDTTKFWNQELTDCHFLCLVVQKLQNYAVKINIQSNLATSSS